MKTILVILFLLIASTASAQTITHETGVQLGQDIAGYTGLGVTTGISSISLRYVHRNFDEHYIQAPVTARIGESWGARLGFIGMVDRSAAFGLGTAGIFASYKNAQLNAGYNYSPDPDRREFNAFTLGLSFRIE